MTIYTFSFSEISILSTRSRNTDTNFSSLVLHVTDNSGLSSADAGPIGLFLGDQGTSVYGCPLTASIDVPDDANVMLNFNIFNGSPGNSAAERDAFQAKMDRATAAVMEACLVNGALVSLAFADFWPAVVGLGLAAVTDLLGAGLGVLNPNCDDWVAGQPQILQSSQMLTNTSTSADYLWSTTYPGQNSPKGCGANSQYIIGYRYTRGDFKPPVHLPAECAQLQADAAQDEASIQSLQDALGQASDPKEIASLNSSIRTVKLHLRGLQAAMRQAGCK